MGHDSAVTPHQAVIRTPLGHLGITTDGRVIRSLEWLAQGPAYWPADDFTRHAAEAVLGWFDDPLHLPALPLAPAPTAFQARVRAALRAIPAGHTRTYGAIARELGSAPRAVGGACRANPLPLIVPCHRVVANDGLGGYSGDWQQGAALSHKQRLLAIERACRRDGAGGRVAQWRASVD